MDLCDLNTQNNAMIGGDREISIPNKLNNKNPSTIQHGIIIKTSLTIIEVKFLSFFAFHIDLVHKKIN